MNIKEIVGLIASISILFSMLFKTTSFKGTIAMRVINLIGSIFFVIYGFYPELNVEGYVPNALATGITNACLFVINIVYLFIEIKLHNKKEKQFNLPLYETEAIKLYQILKKHPQHIVNTEKNLKQIFENNSEFEIWKETIKEIENESNS